MVAANDPQAGALLALIGAPGPTQVPVVGATLNTESGSFINPVLDLRTIEDIPALDPTIWQTFEVGYKGLLLGSNLLLGANVYYTDVDAFVSSLQTFTPNVFLPEAPTEALVLDIDRDGNVGKTVKLKTGRPDKPHAQMRQARKLANGNYLVGHNADRVVREYDSVGKVVRTIAVEGNPYGAVRLRQLLMTPLRCGY